MGFEGWVGETREGWIGVVGGLEGVGNLRFVAHNLASSV